VNARFVVLEGGDGSGKSTQVRLLAAWLRAQGVEVVETFEPGATAAGAAIRELLLHRDEPLDPVAEALLMAATREHVATVVRPALARRMGRVGPLPPVVARVPGRGAGPRSRRGRRHERAGHR
jgi:dTMP kinase